MGGEGIEGRGRERRGESGERERKQSLTCGFFFPTLLGG